MHLVNQRNVDIESAYVIYLPGNATSQRLADQAMMSCNRVNMPVRLWAGFDGSSDAIMTPGSLQNQDWINWIKIYDHFQSPTEVACSLSHISLWAHCMTIDQPIVVLEHDAVMVKALTRHRFYNTIQYLGCKEQMVPGADIENQSWFSSINQNWIFINRAHAYSVDPAVARRLFTMVLERGIFESLDVMIMADVVGIVQDGIYAYDNPQGTTTITNRKKEHDRGPGMIRF